MRHLTIALLAVAPLLACAPAQLREPGGLAAWIEAPHRSERNVARDPYRHPRETLAFFGVREDSTVVEILPGSAGYYGGGGILPTRVQAHPQVRPDEGLRRRTPVVQQYRRG